MAEARTVSKWFRSRRAVAVTVLAAAAVGVSSAAAMAGGSGRGPQAPVVKNAADAHRERIAGFPPAQPLSAADPRAALTVDAAIGKARQRSTAPAATRAALPAGAQVMTMAEFDHRTGLGGDPDIAPDRRVVVVTVHGDMSTDALPGRSGTTQHVYTDVFDQATGTLIEEGIGYAVLK